MPTLGPSNGDPRRPTDRGRHPHWSSAGRLAGLAILVLAMSKVSLVAAASGPGSFVATGALTVPRESHTATLLSDGRVLIVGGSEKAAAAEVWDPASGSFSLTPTDPELRYSHVAAALPDGSVLVAGGAGRDFKRLDTAELWDPVAATSIPLDPMGEPREFAAAVTLLDGRVLVVGGSGDDTPVTSSAETWDPATGAFAPAGSMADARMAFTATTLADGRVLVVGGMDEGSQPLTTAELWDPSSGTFSATGTLAEPRFSHVAVLLADGRVLVAGGLDYVGGMHALTGAEVWDPTTGTFTTAGSMSTARQDLTGTLLPDGRVLVAGGWDMGAGGVVEASADLWDPVTGTFTPAATMIEPRMFHSATLLPDGRVLMVGGWRAHDTDGVAELFDPGS